MPDADDMGDKVLGEIAAIAKKADESFQVKVLAHLKQLESNQAALLIAFEALRDEAKHSASHTDERLQDMLLQTRELMTAGRLTRDQQVWLSVYTAIARHPTVGDSSALRWAENSVAHFIDAFGPQKGN